MGSASWDRPRPIMGRAQDAAHHAAHVLTCANIRQARSDPSWARFSHTHPTRVRDLGKHRSASHAGELT
jgi:hypothetical protein